MENLLYVVIGLALVGLAALTAWIAVTPATHLTLT